MRIEYISHACLLIETEDLRIATDPWFEGPAYCGQWHVFPKPVNSEKLQEVDAILISHGHEDHLHEGTLRLLPKTARVYYPYGFFGGAKEYIESMGFANVSEPVNAKTQKISDATSITYILNSHDSIMVIESGGEVLVNINDALHSYPEKVIDYYLEVIRQRWPKIDYVFCGFGGASYFPNTMHLESKDDLEIGLLREQLFAHNFCRVTAGLKPKVAVPFAADFALLSENQRWINEARFPRNKMKSYYREYFGGDSTAPDIVVMYSGDAIENQEVFAVSPYRKELEAGELLHLVDEQYADEIEAKRQPTVISEVEARELIADVQKNIEKRKTLFGREKLERLKFCLELTDLEKERYCHIEFANGELAFWQSDEPDIDVLLVMSLKSEILRYSIASDWGADVISIGYGAEIKISDLRAAEVDLESVCMNLLACYPTVGDLKKMPLRTLKFLLLNPPKFTTSIRKLKKFNHESENYDRKTWLLEDAEEIRQRYGLPRLKRSFFLSENVF